MAGKNNSKNGDSPFLWGGGEMGELIRSINWTATPLGPPADWPTSLKIAAGMMLTSSFPTLICWGNDFIQLYNDPFRPINGATKHPQAMGGSARDTYAEIWETIGPMFASVMRGETFGFPDFMVPLDRNGYLEDCYFDFSYSPIRDEDGNVGGVLVICIETTGRKIAEEENKTLFNAIKSSEQKLDQIINRLPAHIVVLSGEEQTIEKINDAAVAFWNKDKKEVIGKPLLEVLPELEGQPFPAQLKHVLDTGETISLKESLVALQTPEGGTQNTYVDYSYQPLTDPDGRRTGILVMSFEVTDKVASRELLERYAKELQSTNNEVAAANEELSAANEEMGASNEALSATNDELSATQLELQKIIGKLEKSEARFRTLVHQAPVGIAIFNGRELIIEIVNNEMLKFWGKTAEITGSRLALALPELEGQPFLELIDNVFKTGEVYYGYEAFSTLEHDGVMTDGYHNFIYQPVKNEAGVTTSMMLVAIDVTQQVIAKKAVQRAEQMLRFAIEAANIGTYILYSKTRTLNASPRLKELFGFYPDDEMSYDAAIAQITDDYRDKVVSGVEAAFKEGKDFYLEYKIIGYRDQQLRWVRDVGKVDQYSYEGENIFSGALIDITEQKADEQRKNDFIGMVSHELKTPLTSLTAIVQVLNAKLKDSSDSFISGGLDKANVQVKKMSSMINGFLNVSRLESGKLLIFEKDFIINDLITEMIGEAGLIAPGVEIKFSPCQPITVKADRDKIASVISNLLSNAVKYAPKDKIIEVGCKITGTLVQVSVKDQGAGIKPYDQERLFERYYRVETDHNQHISGFGIGLYLSAEIIQRHDGKIWVKSEIGKGSTFYFSLPLP